MTAFHVAIITKVRYGAAIIKARGPVQMIPFEALCAEIDVTQFKSAERER